MVEQGLETEDFVNFVPSIAGDGDAAVDRRVKAKVPVPGAARGERPDAVQIDNVFPMALHEGRGGQLFSQLMQSLHGTVMCF